MSVQVLRLLHNRVSVFGVVELWFLTYSGRRPLLRGVICKGFLLCCVLLSHSEDCLPSLAGFYNFDGVPFVCFVFVACTHSVRNSLSLSDFSEAG